MQENIEKAVHTSSFLVSDLQAAHAIAISENPVLSILLLDMIKRAAEIDFKLKEILTVL